MKNILVFIIMVMGTCTGLQAQDLEKCQMTPQMTETWEPEIEVIVPGEKIFDPPSDAMLLFDGTKESLSANWTRETGKEPTWIVRNKVLFSSEGQGNIKTREKFEDIQLHIEWRSPKKIVNDGQNRGNSGIFFQGKYELQILDSYNNRTYINGQAASIYKQHPPLVNACREPHKWQYYDVVFIAPRFKTDGTLFSPARITVFQNGILVQNNTQIYGTTEYVGLPKYESHGAGPIILQDHNCPVEFRNIWIRKL